MNPTKTIFLFLLISLSIQNVFCKDSGLKLIHADKNVGRKQGDELLRIFTGSVHFRQDTIDMYCNETIFYEYENKAEFIGNVLINDGMQKIWANKIEYYPDEKLAYCRGSVRIKTASDSLASDFFAYNFKTKEAAAQKDVFIYNDEENVRIWGDRGIYTPGKKQSIIEGSARLMRIDTATTDTFIVNAHKLEFNNDSNRVAYALDSVKIIQGRLNAVCDTAIYYVDEDIAWLNNSPYVWYDENELSGVRMKVHFDSLVVRKIEVFGNAVAINHIDTLAGKSNEIKARQIQFDIVEQNPKEIIAVDNASSIYYLKQEETEKGKGSNFATADTIWIFLQEGQLDSIQIIGGAQGTYYPEQYKGEKKFEQ